MADVGNNRIIEEKLTTIGIRKSIRERLSRYARNQKIRPIIADIVSSAVEEWLERQGEQGEAL